MGGGGVYVGVGGLGGGWEGAQLRTLTGHRLVFGFFVAVDLLLVLDWARTVYFYLFKVPYLLFFCPSAMCISYSLLPLILVPTGTRQYNLLARVPHTRPPCCFCCWFKQNLFIHRNHKLNK